jgi:hypothetical protein
MTNSHKTGPVEELLSEAANRIRAALWILERAQDRHDDQPNTEGWDFEIGRDALEDVARALASAAKGPLQTYNRDPEALRRALRRPPFTSEVQ